MSAESGRDRSSYERGAARAREELAQATGDDMFGDGETSRAIARQLMKERGAVKPYEPSGDVWAARLARHNGREYTGGPGCWPPEICVGSCAVCPNNTAGETP